MILGVDHVALSCDDLRRAAQNLEREGFRLKFVEERLPNAEAKKPFLREYRPDHGLAYCQGRAGVAVELTRHGRPLTNGPGFYRVRFDGPSVRDLGVPCRDLPASISFWTEGLGFRKESEGPGEARLRMPAPLPAWQLDVRLEAAAAPPATPFLDDDGAACLALLSNRLEEDMSRALQCGGRSGARFAARVNGQDLRIGLLRGPSDELVELIEIQKGNPHGETDH